jgi:ribosomal-protein-alanine acetyltransferase
MKIEIRFMRDEDLRQIVSIEESWDYLSKWGEEGYRAVLREGRIYASLVAEDMEAPMSPENPAQRAETGSINATPLQPPRTPNEVIVESKDKCLIVGFAILAFLIDHCELCNLVVRPSYLSRKVGYLLLQQCFEAARQSGVERMFLEVRQSNRRAIDFYQRNKFRIASERKNYYRNPSEHAWVMERRLESIRS